MKAKFYPTESKLLDLLKFGKLLIQPIEDPKEAALFLDFVKQVQEKLEPYRKSIEVFFLKDEYATQDFNQILIHAYPLFGYRLETYIELLLNEEPKILKSKLYEALVTSALEKVEDHPNPITFIQNLDFDINYKWHLLLLLEDPKKHIKAYFELIQSIKPIFDTFYQPVEEEVIRLGNEITYQLNHNGASYIETLSHHRLNRSILDIEQVNLFISGVFKYTVTINPKPSHLNITWGLNMEEGFMKLSQTVENQLSERVLVFKNLGDKTRYEVIKLISQGVTSIKEIATTIGVSSATISYHMNELLNSKIVTLENQNKKFSYIVDYDLLETMIEDLKTDLMFPKK